MVDGQISATPTTILAGVVIPKEDFPTCEFHPGPWTANEVLKPDNRRHRKHGARGGHDIAVLFKDFCFAADDEDNRPSHIADVEGFIILVKNKNCVIHPAETFRIRIARFTFAPGTGCNRVLTTAKILARVKNIGQYESRNSRSPAVILSALIRR